MSESRAPHPTPHDPRTCQSCAFLRHPAQAAQGAALRKHLATNPLPTQKGGRK